MTMVDTVSHPRTEDAPRVLVTFTVKSDRKPAIRRGPVVAKLKHSVSFSKQKTAPGVTGAVS